MSQYDEVLKSAVDFIQKQLNDHSTQPHGFAQQSGYSWPTGHVEEAVEVALGYVYSFFPSKFSKSETKTIEEASCNISFCDDCDKFLGVNWIGDPCNEVSTSDSSDNDRTGLFQLGRCEEEQNPSYSVKMVENSECEVIVTPTVPAGTEIGYLCASIDNVTLNIFEEFKPYIYAASLYWLLRTDNESDSNRELYTEYRNDMNNFLENKRLSDYSVREDDYYNGIRKVEN